MEHGGNNGDHDESAMNVLTSAMIKRPLELEETGKSADEDEPGLSDQRPNYPTLENRRNCIAVKPRDHQYGRLRPSPK